MNDSSLVTSIHNIYYDSLSKQTSFGRHLYPEEVLYLRPHIHTVYLYVCEHVCVYIYIYVFCTRMYAQTFEADSVP